MLAVLAAVLTLVAAVTRPVWDDGWLELLQSSGGNIWENMLERPLRGLVWASLDSHGLLWSSTYVIHSAGWFCMGLVTELLWLRLFPRLRCLALAAGCLAMAPVLCETQFILITTTLDYLPSILIVYVAFLSFFFAGLTKRGPNWKRGLSAVTVALIFPACLISEYPVPAVCACGVLGWLCTTRMDLARRKRILGICVFFAVGLLGYSLFWSLTDASIRPNVRPEKALLGSSLGYRAKVAAARLPSAVWRISFGKLLEETGRVKLQPSWRGVGVVGVGLVSAIALTLASRRKRTEGGGEEDPGAPSWRDAWPLLLALSVGVAPVVLLRGNVDHGVATRFWLPVLPVAACLTTFILFKLLSQWRAWTVIALVGFMVGYSLAAKARLEVETVMDVRKWGKEVRKHLSTKGITVCVFLADDSASRLAAADYELTARLTESWPQEDRNRFWAFSSVHEMKDSCDIVWPGSSRYPEIHRSVRGVVRAGPVSKFIWVLVRDKGLLEFHPATLDRSLGTAYSRPKSLPQRDSADAPWYSD